MVNLISRKRSFSLKKYGDVYKFTVFSLTDRRFNNIPSEVFDDDSPPWPGVEIENNLSTNDEKTDNNISRAKAKIYDYAMSNSWEYFATFTIDQNKYDRYDLHKWYKDFSRFLYDYQRRSGNKVKYLFIPEMHRDFAWHMHGFIDGLPEDDLTSFVPGIHPQHLIDSGYLNWCAYAERFGFCSFSPIRKKEAVSAYIMKYVGKGMQTRRSELGAYLYYASRGLKTAETLVSGDISSLDLFDFHFAYENDYVSTSFLSADDLSRSPLLQRLLRGDDD